MTTLASKEELAEWIARELDPNATAATKECIRKQCEECKEDFRVNFLTGTIDENERPVRINVKNQRAQLKVIETTFEAAARAITFEPQEIDWRPPPQLLIPILVRFIKRFVEQTGDHATAEKFKAAVGWFDLLSINSTELAALLWAWSRLAGGKAQQLTPNARSIPKQKFLAHWGLLFMYGFAPELALIPDPEQPLEGRTITEYIVTHWSRLSPAFRTAHNQLLQVRGLRAIPAPEIDEFVAPTPAQKREFPWGKYLTVTGLLAQYVVGPNAMKFEYACGKALGYKSRKRGPRLFEKPTL
jgi:hypothetical protein